MPFSPPRSDLGLTRSSPEAPRKALHPPLCMRQRSRFADPPLLRHQEHGPSQTQD